MVDRLLHPREGDLYKTITVEEYKFELRYGYYAEFERGGDPVVIYPNLIKDRIYTQKGNVLVTAVQEPCEHYSVLYGREKNDCCEDCIHYSEPRDEISVCLCEQNRRE